MIYSGSYALAYGVVYAAVFVAQSLPQENPVMPLRTGVVLVVTAMAIVLGL